MTDAIAPNKAALAADREHAAAVDEYLRAIGEEPPKRRRGRPRKRETMNERLRIIDEQLMPNATGVALLDLVVERRVLVAELARPDLAALEADFVKVAAAYGAQKGVTYADWEDVGVPPRVLEAARIWRNGEADE